MNFIIHIPELNTQKIINTITKSKEPHWGTTTTTHSCANLNSKLRVEPM